MPRKKVKRSKAIKQSISIQSAATSANMMEKAFKSIPGKLLAQLRKDQKQLKQNELQLLSTLKQMEAQKKVSQKKQDVLTTKLNNKATPALKKQATVLKVASKKINQSISLLEKQIAKIKKENQLLSDKRAKFASLSKDILKLEKQWKAPAKPQEKAKKPLIAKVKKPKKAPQTVTVESQITTFSNPEPIAMQEDFPENVHMQEVEEVK